MAGAHSQDEYHRAAGDEIIEEVISETFTAEDRQHWADMFDDGKVTSPPVFPPRGASMKRFNNRFATTITNAVSTMWCAYAFILLALVSLPSAIKSGNAVTLVSWISQTFLQLVLLSVIMVGQRVLADQHVDLHDKVDALHEKTDAVHEHLGIGS